MRDDLHESRSRDRGDPTERGPDARGGDPLETFRVTVQDESDPCEVIVRSVAAITGTDPLELPPLVRTIDPESLRRLVSEDTDPTAELCVAFTYADCFISIGADGELSVREPGPPV